MTAYEIERLILEWVEENYGGDEADDPSWRVKELSEFLYEKLKGEKI